MFIGVTPHRPLRDFNQIPLKILKAFLSSFLINSYIVRTPNCLISYSVPSHSFKPPVLFRHFIYFFDRHIHTYIKLPYNPVSIPLFPLTTYQPTLLPTHTHPVCPSYTN